MVRWPIALTMLALAACSTPDTPENCRLDPLATIPLRVVAGLPLLDVRIHDQPATMVLDTGAQFAAVLAGSADRLGLENDYTRTAQIRSLGSANTIWPTKPTAVAVGSETTVAAPMLVTVFDWRLPGPDRIDGLLGGPALSSYDLDIDVPQRRLTLYRPRNCPGGPPPFTSASTPIRTGAGTNTLSIPVVLDGHTTQALIDTGANRSMVYARSVGLTQADLEPDQRARMATADSTGLRVHEHRFAHMRVGSEIVEQPAILVTQRPLGVGASALLGSDYWQDRRLWLSYRSGAVWIGPPQPRPR